MSQHAPRNRIAMLAPAVCSALAIGLIAGTYGKKSPLDNAAEQATATWQNAPVSKPSSAVGSPSAKRSVDYARSLANAAASEPVKVVDEYSSAANLVNRGSVLTAPRTDARSYDPGVVKTQMTTDAPPPTMVRANSVLAANQGPIGQPAPIPSAQPMVSTGPTVVEGMPPAGYVGGMDTCSSCQLPHASCVCEKKGHGSLLHRNRAPTAQDCFPPQGFGCDRCPCPCPSEEVLSYYRCNFYGHFPTLWRPWPNDWMKYRPIVPNTMYDRFRKPPKGAMAVDAEDTDSELKRRQDELRNSQPQNSTRPTRPTRTPGRPEPETLDNMGGASPKTSFLGRPTDSDNVASRPGARSAGVMLGN